jgi:CRISPR/Cas system-associated endoribonuclease Cas2
MKLRSTMIALIIAALPNIALAQSTDTKSTPRIDQRQAEQEKRIQQGVKSGQLTDKEAKRLEKDQARIQKMENKAMADGKMTKKEARRIEKAQDRESKKIYREAHDKQTAK